MKFVKLTVFLNLFVFSWSFVASATPEPADSNGLPDPSTLIPCWKQSWQIGTWQPLTYTPTTEEFFVEGFPAPDRTILMSSVCLWCKSARIVDSENKMERFMLSPKANKKHCEHAWRPAVLMSAYEQVKSGDALFVIYDNQGYVILLDEIYGRNFDSQKISYRLAKLSLSGNSWTKVNLQKLSWKKMDTEKEIPLAKRTISFFAETGGEDKYITISYDNCYGILNVPVARPYWDSAHIAIIHKSYLENNSTIDLTKFRFKTWEDGLENQCDRNDSNKVASPTKENISK
jgi:hypothetical protein